MTDQTEPTPVAPDTPSPKIPPRMKRATSTTDSTATRSTEKASRIAATTSKPMDSSTKEVLNPVPMVNHPRTALGLVVLKTEVQHLYPEVGFSSDDYDGRNTALTGTFDLRSLGQSDRVDLVDMFMLLINDYRVQAVAEDSGEVRVTLRSNPRTQDSIGPFRVASILDALGSDVVEIEDDPLGIL